MTTQITPAVFDPIHTPLTGSLLIEASAGTGKTYSLAFLYLRFILEQNLSVEEILVTTFTKAAVAELKERLFARLLAVENKLLVLEGFTQTIDNETKITDSLLNDYLANLLQQVELATIKLRVQQAITQFDQAQIHTIDGVALQLYQENYLSMGTFPLDEVVNNNQVFIEKRFYTLANTGFAQCKSPEKTANIIVPLNNQMVIGTLNLLINKLDRFDPIDALFADNKNIENQFDSLRDAYLSNPQIKEAIYAATDNKTLKNTRYKLVKIEAAHQLLLEGDIESCIKEKQLLALFGATDLLNHLAKGKTFNVTPFHQQLDDLLTAFENYIGKAEQDYHTVMLELAYLIKASLKKEQAQAATLSHGDITTMVTQAAEKGQINHPFKVAMIDESQDTSPFQVTLFKALFIDRNQTCIFVGDPKQAIYGFRGADIYSYLTLYQQVDKHYVLDTNFRSSLGINQFINQLFDIDNPFVEKKIHYYPIASHQQNTDLSDNNAVDIIYCDAFSSDALATQCALQIADYLGNDITVADRAIKPNDIAVLVRSDSQAKKVKLALAQQNIPAAHKGKDSIYNSEECILFYWLLEAISNPSGDKIKRLLVTPLFNYSFKSLHNETLISDYCQQFQYYQTMVDKVGVTITLNQLIREQHIAYHLLNQPEGSRRLTNFFHLFESIQTEIKHAKSNIYSALQGLAERINQHESLDELRLDDENAVTIQTIHKSKGLEYPIVFLPFLAYGNRPRTSGTDIIDSNVLQQASFVGSASQVLKQQSQFEDRAENRRLSYVALTRAKYKTFLFLPNESIKNQGDLVTIINANPKLLNNLQSNHIARLKPEINESLQPKKRQADYQFINRQGKVSTKTTNFNHQWLLDSFSGLTRHLHHDAQTIREIENEEEANHTALLQFPRGAVAGTALHEVFEDCMAMRGEISGYLQNKLNKYLLQVNDISKLSCELADILAAPLLPQTFALNDIAVDKQAIEMKFFLHLSAKQRQLLAKQIHNSSPAIDSYLHGFIDLFFEHQGKFYILDYKSNYLGSLTKHYNQATMQTAMQENHYFLQALIYSIAIDKHLTLTLPNYHYQSHFGGVYYLFIRGMIPNQDTGIYYFKPDASLIELFRTEVVK